MPYTERIVEGVMNRVIYEIGRVVWNLAQEPWGSEWNGQFTPVECGPVSVEITRHEEAMCAHMEVVAFDARVGTWLDSKRPFYHAHLPEGWTDTEFISWAQRIFPILEHLALHRGMRETPGANNYSPRSDELDF